MRALRFAASQRGAVGFVALLLLVAALVGATVVWQFPSQDTCRALTQSHNALTLSGNLKTPSLVLTYHQFRLAPCHSKITEALDAAQMAQKEETRRYVERQAEEKRRRAILDGKNGPPNHVFPSQAAYEAHEKEYAQVLQLVQSEEPCRTRLQVEADGRSRFASLRPQEQRELSEIIKVNAAECR